MRDIALLARSLLREVVVGPIRRGHPRPSKWPPGVGAVVTGTLVLFVILMLAVVFSPILRSTLPLVMIPGTDAMPAGALQLFFIALIVIAILLQVGGIHGNLLVMAISLLITFMTFSHFQPVAGVGVKWGSLAAFSMIVVMALVRHRRPFQWWEIPMVGVPMLIGTLTPLWEGRPYMLSYLDNRGMVLQLALVMLTVAAAPALVSAGFAASEIALRAADWAADRFTESLRRSVPWVTAALVAALGVELVLALQSGPPDLPTLRELGGSLAHICGAVVFAIPVWLLSSRKARTEPPDLQHLRERWEPTALGLGILLAVQYGFAALGATVMTWGTVLDRPAMNDLGLEMTFLLSGSVATEALFLAFALLLWVKGLAEARKGHILFGLAGAALTSQSVMSLLRTVSEGAFDIPATSDAMGVLAAGTGISILLWDAIVPGKAPTNVSALLLIALPVIYHFRFVLAEPLTALIGTGGAAIAVVGLSWDAASGWDMTEREVRGVPEVSRVLILAASLLAAAASIAYNSLTRSTGSLIDTSVFPLVGDLVIGLSMFMGALLVLGFAALHPKGSAGRVAAGTHSGPGHSAFQ